jgi:predicted cation transporter
MFAVIAFICGVVAAILKLTSQHANLMMWLIIIGLIAVSVEGLWGWHRSGYYGHRGA